MEALCEGPVHINRWSSSIRLQHQSNPHSSVFATDIAVPAAIIATGCSFSKLQLFAKVCMLILIRSPRLDGRYFQALRLKFGGESHFWRIQRACGVPAVAKATKECRNEMFARLKKIGPRLILAGDGQYDSPGSCAKQCSYTLIVNGIEKEKNGQEQFFESGYVRRSLGIIWLCALTKDCPFSDTFYRRPSLIVATSITSLRTLNKLDFTPQCDR